MGCYFKPTRRKIGIAMLLLACLLMGEWVRSLTVSDMLTWATGRTMIGQNHSIDCYTLTSVDSYLVLGFLQVSSSDSSSIDRIESVCRIPAWEKTTNWEKFRNGELKIVWFWSTIGYFERPDARGWRCLVPYWIICIPVTVVAMWLLLSKSRAQERSSKLVTNQSP